MKYMYKLAYTLVIIGGLNWGLVGLLNFNLVNMLVGSIPVAESGIYTLVGLSTLIILCPCMTKYK